MGRSRTKYWRRFTHSIQYQQLGFMAHTKEPKRIKSYDCGLPNTNFDSILDIVPVFSCIFQMWFNQFLEVWSRLNFALQGSFLLLSTSSRVEVSKSSRVKEQKNKPYSSWRRSTILGFCIWERPGKINIEGRDALVDCSWYIHVLTVDDQAVARVHVCFPCTALIPPVEGIKALKWPIWPKFASQIPSLDKQE